MYKRDYFNQQPTSREKDKVQAGDYEIPKGNNSSDKSRLAELYLIFCAIFGKLSEKAISLFNIILERFDDDVELHSSYYKGIEDEKKKQPYR